MLPKKSSIFAHWCIDSERYSNAGSADRSVKFWDLETFELIGSAGPEVCAQWNVFVLNLKFDITRNWRKAYPCEIIMLFEQTSGVRSMVFNPDGRTLLTGLHENMKVSLWIILLLAALFLAVIEWQYPGLFVGTLKVPRYSWRWVVQTWWPQHSWRETPWLLIQSKLCWHLGGRLVGK